MPRNIATALELMRFRLQRPPTVSASYYREQYKQKGIRIGVLADKMLDAVQFDAGPDVVPLACISADDPRIHQFTREDEQYGSVFFSGRRPLPDWVGPELRNMYSHQPWGELLIIGMNPILVEERGPRVFRVETDNSGIPWLRIAIGYAPSITPGCSYVF